MVVNKVEKIRGSNTFATDGTRRQPKAVQIDHSRLARRTWGGRVTASGTNRFDPSRFKRHPCPTRQLFVWFVSLAYALYSRWMIALWLYPVSSVRRGIHLTRIRGIGSNHARVMVQTVDGEPCQTNLTESETKILTSVTVNSRFQAITTHGAMFCRVITDLSQGRVRTRWFLVML